MTTKVSLAIEVTGPNPEGGDRIIEICCLLLENRKPVDVPYFYYALDPEGRKISKEAESLPGISDEVLVGNNTFKDVEPTLCNIMKGREVISKNAQHDIAMLNSELQRIGADWRAGDEGVVCVSHLARALDYGQWTDAKAPAGAKANARSTAEAYLKMSRQYYWGEWSVAIERQKKAQKHKRGVKRI